MTTLTVQAGDNQSGEPGRPLPASISVIARDAAGQGVAGTVVAFAVDSGGGTVASPQVTTDANGVAAVAWTLGMGPNVVIASVGTLPPVRFRAVGRLGVIRTLINKQVVGSGGGTLRYIQPGDALSGLRISVPADAYPGSTTWTVTADSTAQVPLPADFSQVGPVLVIGNGQGYAASLIALTVPMQLSAADAVAPFFYDPASGILEAVPLLARTDSSITFASRHFSGSLMAIPGSAPGPSGLRSALREFGTINMVFMRIPLSKLIGTFTSTFRPGQDDWEFTNNGDFQSALGSCEGMTATALYYHYFFTSKGAPSLFGRFTRFLTNNWGNARGIHLAGAIQADYKSIIYTMRLQQIAIRDATERNGETPEALAATWILLNLKANKRPLLVGVSGPAGSHALVAYQATATAGSVVVGIADPNSPGVSRTMTFQGGGMVPLPFRTIDTGPEDMFVNATVFGVTTEVPLTNFNSRWAEFVAGSPGEDRLPNPRQFEVYDSVNATWVGLTDTVRLVADTLMLRMRCPSCAVTFTSATGGPNLIQLEVNDPSGTTPFSLGIVPQVHVVEGEQDFFVLAKAFHGGPRPSFVDSRLFTVVRGKLRLFPLSLAGNPDTAYRFTLTHGGLAKPDTRFVWDFGDGTPLQTVIGDSLRTHIYTAIGNYTVTVEMRDGGNRLMGRTTSLVAITVVSAIYTAWKITSMTTTTVNDTRGVDTRSAADGNVWLSLVADHGPTTFYQFLWNTYQADSTFFYTAQSTNAAIMLVARDTLFGPPFSPLSGALRSIYWWRYGSYPTSAATPFDVGVGSSNNLNRGGTSCRPEYSGRFAQAGTTTAGRVTGLNWINSIILTNGTPAEPLVMFDYDVAFSGETATGTTTKLYRIGPDNRIGPIGPDCRAGAEITWGYRTVFTATRIR